MPNELVLCARVWIQVMESEFKLVCEAGAGPAFLTLPGRGAVSLAFRPRP